MIYYLFFLFFSSYSFSLFQYKKYRRRVKRKFNSKSFFTMDLPPLFILLIEMVRKLRSRIVTRSKNYYNSFYQNSKEKSTRNWKRKIGEIFLFNLSKYYYIFFFFFGVYYLTKICYFFIKIYTEHLIFFL